MSKQNVNLNGGDIVVKGLVKEGITTVYGIIGGELTRIYDAIERWGREEGIKTVMVRHEQAGGHMADAWARVTGELGVCLGTAGPGVTHLVPAIAAAWADSVPMLVIGAQVARNFDDSGILQGGLDQMKLMEPITKLQISVEEPYEIPHAIKRAIKVAMSGRRAPVFLELRETALVRDASERLLKELWEPSQYRALYKPGANPEVIENAVELLKTAKKPILLSGGGLIASEASPDLIKLSETYMIPAATTIRGIGGISVGQKTYLGSYPTANAFRTAASEADVVISIGCKWDFTVLYGTAPVWNQNQKIIQIDIDENEIGKNRPAAIGIIGDAKATILQLLKEMEAKLPKDKITEWSEWNDYLQALKQNDEINKQKILNAKKLPMKPERMVIEVLDNIDDDSIIVIDGGDIAVFTYSQISYKKRNPRSTLSSLTMGHLGVGIPYAIGAKMARPDKQVVLINGDGSFLFNVQELETAVRLNVPIIIFIANNCAWGMLKSYQKLSMKKRFCDVDLGSIDYSAIAKGFGCYAEKVENPEDIKEALKRAIESKKPAVIDVSIAFETPPAMKLIGLYKKSKGLFGATEDKDQSVGY